MDFEKLKQKAFVFIGDNDEYAEIIPDGNVDKAAKLLADFVHNLWECGQEYKPEASENTLPIDSVRLSLPLSKHIHEYLLLLRKVVYSRGETGLRATRELTSYKTPMNEFEKILGYEA